MTGDFSRSGNERGISPQSHRETEKAWKFYETENEILAFLSVTLCHCGEGFADFQRGVPTLIVGADRVAVFLVVELAGGVVGLRVGYRLLAGGGESCGMVCGWNPGGCGVNGFIE